MRRAATSDRVRTKAAGLAALAALPALPALAALPALIGASACAGEDDPERWKGVRYGPYATQLVDLYPPEQSDGPTPLVLYFHGGGFDGGTRDLGRFPDLMEAVTAAGMTFASADYGLAPDVVYPETYLDAARAVQFLRANAEAYGLDPTRVVVAGRSAGAVLAGWLAYGPDQADPASDDPVLHESSRPVAWVNVSGQTDFHALDPTVRVPLFGGRRIGEVDQFTKNDASPLRLLMRSTEPPPPVFSLYGESGGSVPARDPHDSVFGKLLAKELGKRRDRRSVLRIGGAVEGSDRWLDPGRVDEIVAWIRERLEEL